MKTFRVFCDERLTNAVPIKESKIFFDDIEEVTKENYEFRKVLYTGRHLQLVLMTLNPGEEIGEEIHNGDQFFRFEEGEGTVVINDIEHKVESDFGLIVPMGIKHNIINTGTAPLKLYTLYSPPQH